MFQAVSMFFQQTCLRGTSEKGKDVINQSKRRDPRRCYSGDSHPNHRKNMGMPRDAYLLHESTRFTPLKTNMTGRKISIFNRKCIDSFMVDYPASHPPFVFGGGTFLDRSATHGSHLEELGIPNPQLRGQIWGNFWVQNLTDLRRQNQPSSKVMDRKLEKKHVFFTIPLTSQHLLSRRYGWIPKKISLMTNAFDIFHSLRCHI